MEGAKKEEIFRGQRISLHQLLVVAVLAGVWFLGLLNVNLFAEQVMAAVEGTHAYADYNFHSWLFEVGCVMGVGISLTSDLFGRKRALLFSLLLPLFSTAFFGIFPNKSVFSFGRLINGVGYTSSMAISATMAVESTPFRLLPLIVFAFSLSDLDHYAYLVPFNFLPWRALNFLVIAFYSAIGFLVYRFIDESLSFLMAKANSSSVHGWIIRAKIAQNVDTLQLDKYEEQSNEEEKDDVESMQEEGQQMQPSIVMRTLKSIDIRSVITILLISIVCILELILNHHYYEFVGFYAHHQYAIGPEFFFHEILALLLASFIAFNKIGMLNGLIGVTIIKLPLYALLGIFPNSAVWYILRILNTAAVFIIPFFALSSSNLLHRTSFLHAVLVVKDLSVFLMDDIGKINRESHTFDPLNLIIVVVVLAILVVLKKKL